MLPLIRIIGVGLAGVAIGAVASKYFSDEEIKEKDEEIARTHMKAQRLDEELRAFHQKLGDTKEYFDFILGVMAFGVAIARVDKEGIDEDEKRELEEFLLGVTSSNLPQHIKDAMRKIYEDKTISFEKALGFLYKIDTKGRKLIEDALYVIAHCNNNFTQEQKEFIQNYRIEEAKIPYLGESIEESQPTASVFPRWMHKK